MYSEPKFKITELEEEDVIVTSDGGLTDSDEIPEFDGVVEFG